MIGYSRTKLRVDDVRRAVQVAMRVKREDMLSESSTFDISRPRQIVMALAHELGCGSSAVIARAFGFGAAYARRAKTRVLRRERASSAYKQDLDNLRVSLLVYRAQIEQAGWSEPHGAPRPERKAPTPPPRPAPLRKRPARPSYDVWAPGTPIPSAWAAA